MQNCPVCKSPLEQVATPTGSCSICGSVFLKDLPPQDSTNDSGDSAAPAESKAIGPGGTAFDNRHIDATIESGFVSLDSPAPPASPAPPKADKTGTARSADFDRTIEFRRSLPPRSRDTRLSAGSTRRSIPRRCRPAASAERRVATSKPLIPHRYRPAVSVARPVDSIEPSIPHRYLRAASAAVRSAAPIARSIRPDCRRGASRRSTRRRCPTKESAGSPNRAR